MAAVIYVTVCAALAINKLRKSRVEIPKLANRIASLLVSDVNEVPHYDET